MKTDALAAPEEAGPDIATTNDATPQLRRPRAFASAALADLRRAPAAGFVLFRASLRARHRRLWLGYAWLLLPGIMFALIFTMIRANRLIIMPETILPYPIFVLAGIYLWQSFIDALNMPLQQFTTHRHFLANNAVAHEAVLFAGLLELLLNMAIRLILLFVAAAIAGLLPVATWLLLPLGAALLILLGFGAGLLLTPLGLLYDDVSRAIGLVAGFAIFLTPVFYAVPPDSLLWFNPVTPLLDGTRGWLRAAPVGGSFLLVAALALAACVLAWGLYRVARPHLLARAG